MKLDEARKSIPHFDCNVNCHECCGKVPWSMEEYGRLPVEEQRAAVEHARKPAKERAFICPFADKGGCRVYGERPLMCRLFGAVEDLRCPYGYRPEILLTRKQAQAIIVGYYRNQGGSHAPD